MRLGLITLVAALVGSGTALQASSLCPGTGPYCIEVLNTDNAFTGAPITINNDGISPYNGLFNATVGGVTESAAMLLFCDDLDNHNPIGSFWSVDVTNITGNLSQTKYGSANPVAGKPTGQTLYELNAWLFTQMLLSGNQDATTLGYIQEAAWSLTAPDAAMSPEVDDWLIAAAEAVALNSTASTLTYDGTSHPLAPATYADWYVFTDASFPGDDSPTNGLQEVMTFIPPQSTPEPGSLLLTLSAVSGLLIWTKAVRPKIIRARRNPD